MTGTIADVRPNPAVPATTMTSDAILAELLDTIRSDRTTDLASDLQDYRDIPIAAIADSIFVDTDTQFGYFYLPNLPRDVTIYSGHRGALIGTFPAGRSVFFRMARQQGFTILYGAGTAGYFAVHMSARPIQIDVIGAVTSDYLPFSTPVSAASGNVANAQAVATLPAVAGKTNYLSGFTVTGSGATAGLPVVVTVTGLLGGTLSFVYTAAAGVLVANTPLVVTFARPIPASAVNTAIVVTCPALGAGNTNNAVVANGYVV